MIESSDRQDKDKVNGDFLSLFCERENSDELDAFYC